MTEEIFATVTDEGPMGAKLVVFVKPRGCPGLGGWKSGKDGTEWWTRVKGEDAARVLETASIAPGNVVSIMLDGDKITDISF